jgi:hypothetical protein
MACAARPSSRTAINQQVQTQEKGPDQRRGFFLALRMASIGGIARPRPIANATLVNLLKINNIHGAAPSRGLRLFWEPFWRKSVSPSSDADGQT